MRSQKGRQLRSHLLPALLTVVFMITANGAYSAGMTVEQKIDRALASRSIGWVSARLKEIPKGTPRRDKVVAHLAQLKKDEAKASKKQEAKNRANAVKLRRAYGKILRNKFLDDGMDIKVRVTGASATRLKFNYPLFNDVWTHKFQQGSLIKEIKSLGFKRVDFNNGYDYHVYFTFK